MQAQADVADVAMPDVLKDNGLLGHGQPRPSWLPDWEVVSSLVVQLGVSEGGARGLGSLLSEADWDALDAEFGLPMSECHELRLLWELYAAMLYQACQEGASDEEKVSAACALLAVVCCN